MDFNFTEELMNTNDTGLVNFTCITPFDSQEYTNVAIVNTFVAVLSFISTLFVVVFILATKKWQFFSERLILYLTISAMLFSVANIINRVDFHGEKSSFYNGFCAFSGVMTQVTAWFCFMAYTSITLHLFFRSILNKSTEKYEWAYVFLIFVVPLLFNWIPFVSNLYGKAGVWCWISSFDLVRCSLGCCTSPATFLSPSLLSSTSLLSSR